MKLIVFGVLLVVLSAGFASSDARPQVPALYVFGDSLVDVGNNKYLPPSPNVSTVDFLPYGIDFSHSKPTGRFSNGYNSMDYIAMKLGFKRSPRPYLSLKNTNHRILKGLYGANFASGGSGILDETGIGTLTLTKQIEDFAVLKTNIAAKLGPVNTNRLLSKSIFVISAGSNDLGRLKDPSNAMAFLVNMTTKYHEHLTNLYELGARKFAILGISLVGCTPAARSQSPNCSSAANSFAGLFNNATTLVLQNMSDALEGFNYSFCSAYNLVNEVVVNPQKYGFTNITNQCCGYDEKDLKCRPTSHYCDDRRKFVFWDGVHPTEAMCEIAGSAFYNGSQEFAFPHNLMQLAKEE